MYLLLFSRYIMWTAAHKVSLSSTLSQSLLKAILSNHLIFCHSFLLLPSIFPSIRVFSNELALCIRWPKYWSFSFSNSPSSEYSGLISFRIDWFDPLAVQGTLKSFLQQHNLKALILQHSAFLLYVCVCVCVCVYIYSNATQSQLIASMWEHSHCGQSDFFKGNNKFIYSDKIFRSLNFGNQFKTIKNDVQATERSPCSQLN